ncbi:DNA polymerase III subunit delta' [Spiroplasma corruscae]|uniref:DNA polymerase III subunit delta n=1 Tax=Spiroplasma corruscae TaxID=216934 RepID=A0A222ENB5_9MOLU|nr:DNA polymerase III subunit delta' [Spiroplasma corruscae]ASP27784.1 DNA polymerase III subunit delta' [Spiroplasma corruscae]
MTKLDFLNTIYSSILNKKLHHSIILESNEQEILEECGKEFERILFCESHSIENDDCSYCKLVNNNNNQNLYEVLSDGNQIKKDTIKKVIARLSLTSFQSNFNKLYIIKNGEHLKESAANALLKFLEEPPKNTFCLIFTKDITKILPTIKSRSLIYKTESKNNLISGDKLLNFYTKKNKLQLLEYFLELKTKDRVSVIDALEYNFKAFMRINFRISEWIIEAIEEVGKYNYYILTLENLFYKIIKEL